MLKYSGLRAAADGMFGAFVLAWLVTRQFGLLLVIVSVWEDAGRLMPIDSPELVEIGPYDLVRPTLLCPPPPLPPLSGRPC